jgi:ribosomal protein S18 acetylase RimI-like enzyme
VGGAKKILDALTASIWHREVVQISGRIVKDHLNKLSQMEFPRDIECAVVESAEELEAFENHMSPALRDSPEKLKRRLSERCVVFFAMRRTEAPAAHEILGYCLGQKGVFSALGRKALLAPDILFVHYIEVLPGYRSQGIAKSLLRATYEYAERHGFERTITVRSPTNQLSGQAFRQAKDSYRILGEMERISILRGLVVWHTPWRKIERAIGRLNEEPVRGSKFEAEAVRGSGFGAEAVRGSGFEVGQQVEVEKSEQVEVKAEVQQR